MVNEQKSTQYLYLTRELDKMQECPIKSALEVIGGKWKLRIILELLIKEVMRFNELKREITGITNTMLSNSLHELENDELITRNQYNEMPVRVEYILTDKGKSMLPIFYELIIWWNKYRK